MLQIFPFPLVRENMHFIRETLALKGLSNQTVQRQILAFVISSLNKHLISQNIPGLSIFFCNITHKKEDWKSVRFSKEGFWQWSFMKKHLNTNFLRWKNVPKMPIPFLNMPWHVGWYLMKKEIGHVFIQNHQLYVLDYYIRGWSGANPQMGII